MDEVLLTGSSSPSETGLQSGRYKTTPGKPFVEEAPARKNFGVTEYVKKNRGVRNPSMEDVFAGPNASADKEKVTEEISESGVDTVHPDDNRLNLFEINFASGLFYNQASSSHSFRQYSSFAPHILVGGTFWISPQFATFGQTIITQGADISSDPKLHSRVAVKHELTDIGVKIRKHFGSSRKANSVEAGLQFSEYRLTIPSDETKRVKLKSTGLGLLLLTRVPVSPSFSWVFGAEFFPRMNHQETATALDLQSGTGVETSRFSLQLGGEFKLSREHQVTWNLKSIIEKNQFTGPASQIDPETSSAASGVSVSNSLTIFSFGYRWGH